MQTKKTHQPTQAISNECEVLYVASAPLEHVEEYLEAAWLSEERGENITRVTWFSKRLNVSPPSAVEMLRRLEGQGYLKYLAREGVQLTAKGREIGRRMVRNGRLIEVLMVDKFHIKVDAKIACGIEHHLTDDFSNALCTMLGHPSHCPHGLEIPAGKCCPRPS